MPLINARSKQGKLSIANTVEWHEIAIWEKILINLLCVVLNDCLQMDLMIVLLKTLIDYLVFNRFSVVFAATDVRRRQRENKRKSI